MNTTNYTGSHAGALSAGASGGWPTISVSWRDAVWLSAGFGFGSLGTMCLVVACSRCRRRKRGNDAESHEESHADML